MAVLTFTSAKGAPGTTTTALSLLFSWPRPALLVEADPAGSSLLPGYLRGGVDHNQSVIELSLAQQDGHLDHERLWEQIMQLAPDRYLLPGLVDPAQAPSMTGTWAPLLQQLAALEDAGIDVLVDAGQIGLAYPPVPLIRGADLLLLVSGSHLTDVYSLSRRAAPLMRDMTREGNAGAVQVLLVGEGRPYKAPEIRNQLSLPVIGSLAWDPASAQTWSAGAPRGRSFASSALTRSADALANRLFDHVQQRRQELQPDAWPVSSRTGTGDS